MKVSTEKIILSCEHGGNKVPKQFLGLFTGNRAVLNTHRAWDRGALVLAKAMSSSLSAPLVYSEITRLLVDLNRSLHNRHLFSEYIHRCDKQIINKLLDEIYFPYRQRIKSEIRNALKKNNSVIHFSIHSFTPELNGQTRNADIGLLYDPARTNERVLCKKLRLRLNSLAPYLKIRRNYPYRGNTDGLTTHLRQLFDTEKYSGIEIEINQKHVKSNNKSWLWLQRLLIDAIYTVLEDEYRSVGQ